MTMDQADDVLLLARPDPVPRPEVVAAHEQQVAIVMAKASVMPGRPEGLAPRSLARWSGGHRSPQPARSLRMCVAVVAAAVAAMTAAWLPLRRTAERPTQVATAAPTSAVAPAGVPYSGVDPKDLASTHATPTYLPLGAVYKGGHTVKYVDGWVDSWSLPGEVNSRVMPPTPADAVPGMSYHPETDIALTQLAGTFSSFQGADTRLADITTVDLNGVPATVVTPVNGYGVYRIAWVRGGVSYDLQTQRLKVSPDGTMSGIPLSELLRMAQSIG